MQSPVLSDMELRRYSRQIKLNEIGVEGQQILKNSKVLVIGAGGLGTPVLQYLAAAGVGEICICDADYVNETNFHRQIMYGASDLGKLKTIVAKEKLQLLNPLVKFTIVNILVNKDNVETIISNYDVIADCTNNLVARQIISEGCKKLSKPLVYGSICNFEGILGVFNYKTNQNLATAPASNISNDEENKSGILGVIPGIIGCSIASEVLKLLLNIGSFPENKFLLFNILNQSFEYIDLKR
jgi:sulfur-carrier protein adenylyltransferase/sulfurtransferase